MFRNLLLAGFFLAVSTAAGPNRAPVLVELFTSEGCSSCPPADRLLQVLDPQAIVLSEHVDYWDHLGWRDRFSSHLFTDRQQAYARIFHTDGPYTPQMVVDGAVEFLGSDGRRAAGEIDKAARRSQVEPKVTRTANGIRVEVDSAPNPSDVMLALADDPVATQVAAGENKGRSLRHVAVVRSLRKIGGVKRGTPFAAEIPLPPTAREQRIVVFVQESGQSRITGAAMLPAGS